jgi:molybdopterin-containing oxidoreductase family iron-sulfur binding subunit
MHLDETVSACAVKLPSSHPLESWNDAAPRPGVASLAQPVIAPLYKTRPEAESLLRWAQALAPEGDELKACRDVHDVIRLRWGREVVSEAAAIDAKAIAHQRRQAWESALRAGGRFAPADPPFPAPAAPAAPAAPPPPAAPDEALDLVVLPHPALHDGRFANVAWLQELPDPVTRVVWDDVASLGPETAKRLGVAEGDPVTVRAGGASVGLPALVQPGQAEGTVVLALGRGRTAGGEVLKAAGGANAAPFLGAAAAAVAKAPGPARRPVRVQETLSQHGRDIVLDGTLEAYRTDADFVRRRRPPAAPPDLYEPVDYSKGPKWAMAVDLNACTGCGACVVACQAENNVGVVGRAECARQREMHWIRIDRYEEADGRVHHLPMLCQHCDHAPCETVCPVYATAHSPEGLNEMVYNRCVGTRYCANNCPFKVRRFNYLRYPPGAGRAAVQELVHNPQVTVRSVGVMEKCTFCVQRITEAQFRAKAGEAPPKPLSTPQEAKAGAPAAAAPAVTPACAQACPAGAIAFGDANAADGPLAKARASRRAFHVLEMLNVKPNVTYLARVRNPAAAPRPAGGGRPG